MHNLSLTIHISSLTQDLRSVQFIILPALQHCYIGTSPHFSSANDPDTKDLDPNWQILRSGNTLETLRIKDSILTLGEIESILANSPRLTELELPQSGPMFTPSILQKLASGQLAPRLRKLRCMVVYHASNKYGALDRHLDMLEERKRCSETKAQVGTRVSRFAEVRLQMRFSRTAEQLEEPMETPLLDTEKAKRLAADGWNLHYRILGPWTLVFNYRRARVGYQQGYAIYRYSSFPACNYLH
ncbi:hypothetical protein H0H92_002366 [Tricholoma furcatifolium]|nr:hypothetical protein H0H92_002366 [Tricholoma furcatifolium]